MKFLFDLFPVIFFFAAYKYAEDHRGEAVRVLVDYLGFATVEPTLAPILLATVAVIVAAGVQIVWARLRHGRVDKVLWLSFVIVIVLGGLTLLFQNDVFIKWKPTILYWGLASGMLFASLALNRNSVRAMLADQITLPEAVWKQINGAMMGFLYAMGFINLAVAFFNPLCTSPETCQSQWVNFKVFGIPGLTLAFFLVQALLLYKHIEEK